MNCHEARERLAAFQDGALAPDEAKAMDAHLAGCPACAAELGDLVRAMKLVRELPEVEPPPFYAKKIMAQVRAGAGEPQGLWRRLFYPLHVKIPIQALTAVFVAVLSVYVYKSMGPESLKTARLEPAGETVPSPAAATPVDTKPAQKAEESGKAAKSARDDKGVLLEAQKMAKDSYAPPPAASASAKREAPADRSLAEPPAEKKAKLGARKAPAPEGAATEVALGQGTASGGAAAETTEKKRPENIAAKAARDEESAAYAPPPRPAKSMESQDAPGRAKQEEAFAPPPPKADAAPEVSTRAIAGATSAPETGYYEAKKSARPSARKFQAAPAGQAPAVAAPATAPAPPALDMTVAAESAGGEAKKASEKEAAPKAKDGQTAPRSVVVKVKDPAAAADALHAAVSSLGARVKEKQIRSGKEIYVVELDAGRYPALIEKLKAIGAVTRSSPAHAGDEGTIEVRIELGP